MPIESIVSQPLEGALLIPYRPISFIVEATATDDTAQPPVVYCDVYINDVFIKTSSKTQPLEIGEDNSTWYFDISDICQSYLNNKDISPNGGSSIITATNSIIEVFCRFRSSGIDEAGFTLPEGTLPVQGTGRVPAEDGDGTESNTVLVLNGVLQHYEEQDLKTHLNTLKTETWDADTYPLTHRTNNYRVCLTSSDYYPIYSLNKTPNCVRIYYKSKGETLYTSLTNCSRVVECVEISYVGSPNLPNGQVGVAYNYTITLNGTTPFSLSNIIKPSWMTISVTTNKIKFNGTPTTTGADLVVSFTINNCGTPVNFSDNINVISGCVAPNNAGTVSLPDAVVGVPYDYQVEIGGSTPFTLSNIIKPSWMTIVLDPDGIHVNLTGNPIAADNIPISFQVNNDCGNYVHNDTINSRLLYGCGSGIVVSNDPNTSFHSYGNFYLDTDSVASMTILWVSNARPNQFYVVDDNDNSTVATSGWVGEANYPGPWGMTGLSTAQNGSFSFNPIAGHTYHLHVDAGNGDTNDTWEVSIACS